MPTPKPLDPIRQRILDDVAKADEASSAAQALSAQKERIMMIEARLEKHNNDVAKQEAKIQKFRDDMAELNSRVSGMKVELNTMAARLGVQTGRLEGLRDAATGPILQTEDVYLYMREGRGEEVVDEDEKRQQRGRGKKRKAEEELMRES